MQDQHPNVRLLLAGYLHQDWPWDYQTPEDAVARFIHAEPREKVRRAGAELGTVLRTMSDAELEAWLDDTGCMYHPPGAGLSSRTWLERVDRQLRHALAGDPQWRPGPESA